MKSKRRKKFEDISPVEFLVLRDNLGLKRYRKSIKRDEEKRKILLDLGIKKIEEKEKNDFVLLGYRRRRLKIP
jgi:DNA-directed RNA polymerase subunit N (RpoN/RPB10)